MPAADEVIGFSGEADPRHVFLTAREVMARYRWGQTQGYQNLKDRDLVPEPVMRNPNRWRLDQLLAWEDHRIALAQTPGPDAGEAVSKPLESNRELDVDIHRRLAAALPQPKIRRASKLPLTADGS